MSIFLRLPLFLGLLWVSSVVLDAVETRTFAVLGCALALSALLGKQSRSESDGQTALVRQEVEDLRARYEAHRADVTEAVTIHGQRLRRLELPEVISMQDADDRTGGD